LIEGKKPEVENLVTLSLEQALSTESSLASDDELRASSIAALLEAIIDTEIDEV
jgi:hypothetical protein